ncbi:MAG: hypothetical protein ACLUE8_01960 [Lachnospiraceae bacterium]
MNEIIVGLCESRHPLPVEEYIFPESVNPIDFDGMYKTVGVYPEFCVNVLRECKQQKLV